MSVKPYDPDAIRQIISLYWSTFSETPTIEMVYLDNDAIRWDGYTEPVEKLNSLLSDLFRFSKSKQKVDIKLAQEPGGTDNLSIEQIAYFITDILVSEKRHGGLFAQMLTNGVIERVVNRLEVLLAQEVRPWWQFW